MLRKILCFCGSTLLLFCTAAPADNVSAEELVARNAVRLFFEGCLKIYPDPQRFSRWITQNELPLFPEQAMAPFLEGKPGKVWAVDNKDVQYALAAQDDNRCSVFTKQLDKEHARRQLQPMLDALLKPGVRESTDVKVEQASDGSRVTTTYTYELPEGRWLMTITAITDDTDDGLYQFALSAATSMRIKAPTP